MSLALGVVIPSLHAGETVRPIQKRKKHSTKNPIPFDDREDAAGVKGAQQKETRDPLQKLNRGTFAVNDILYRFVLRPVGKVTSFVLTKKGLKCLENALENIETPVRIVGCLFQAKFKRAGQETGKLLVNSTLGVGGLFKVSDGISGLKDVPKEDFGQALASWGIPTGPYVVLPVIGPSNVREIFGHAGDTAANPATWLGDNAVRVLTRGVKTGIENPYRMDLYEAVTSSAIDPYVAAREAYLSRRQHDTEH